jgi:type IV secretion system protein VirB5
MKRNTMVASALLALSLASGRADAMIPVIDVAAVTQLLQQMLSWEEQLRGMQQQLSQLQQTYAAMTGARGMQSVLAISPQARNYLPTDWAALQDVVAGTGSAYADLARAVRAQVAANAVLKPTEVTRFSADLQALLVAERLAVASGQTLNRAAFARTSDRFTSLQTLIDRIGAAPDAKAIAELQGRIGAEQAMVANEGLKLAALVQVGAAESDARALARREQVVANHGGFATRFQPTPPAP